MRILLIHTHGSVNATVARHYPYYLAAGCDRTVGVQTTKGDCKWPSADTVVIGGDSYVSGNHLPSRLIRTLEYAVKEGGTEILVAEYDTIFFKPLPPFPTGFVLNETGGAMPGYRCSRFFHGPWCMDAETAKATVELGDKLLFHGINEGGSPDTFLGYITDLLQIPVHGGVFKNFTRNSLDRPGDLELARQAYRDGVHCIHGIKHERELNFILAK